jgi:hypothetical protein
MTLHQFGPFIPLAITPLVIGLSIWVGVAVRFAYRTRALQAVLRKLASRGETLVAIRDLKVSKLTTTTGLLSNDVFEVVARTPEGGEQIYEWAYEPRVFPWQSEGVKRLAHGIWIAV